VNEETFCERSRNCLSTCGEENCEKEINGWVAAFHRQIQRSQYQIRYGRPFQVVASVVLALLFICEFFDPFVTFFCFVLAFIYGLILFLCSLCSCVRVEYEFMIICFTADYKVTFDGSSICKIEVNSSKC
jgi:hypothetical protein